MGGAQHPGETPVTATLMSWNVQGQVTLDGEAPRATAIATRIAASAPDFVGLQECVRCDRLESRLPDRYRILGPGHTGVAIAYDTGLWDVAETGELLLGSNDDGWGDRIARWGRFRHRTSSRNLYVYSTHWCVTVRRSDDRCDPARQVDYARALIEHMDSRQHGEAPVVLAGDLNVFDGFEDAAPMRYLLANQMVDAFRTAHPTHENPTFEGNHFAPPGRIDYLLAAQPVQVLSASSPEQPGASDHRPVLATVRFPGSR